MEHLDGGVALLVAIGALIKSFVAAGKAKGREEAAIEAMGEQCERIKQDSERRIAQLEHDMRGQLMTGGMVGGALQMMESVDERLGRIETWIFSGNRPPVVK